MGMLCCSCASAEAALGVVTQVAVLLVSAKLGAVAVTLALAVLGNAADHRAAAMLSLLVEVEFAVALCDAWRAGV